MRASRPAVVLALAALSVAAAALAMEGSPLGHLVASSSEPWIPTLLLFGGMMTTFAGLSAGTAIMLTVGRGDDGGR